MRPATALVSLEPRALLAGNVTAAIHNGTLRINGDAADNQIRLFVENGHLVLSGEEGTTINGAATPFRVLTGSTQLTGKLIAEMGSGDDRFAAQGPFTVSGRMYFYGGAGDDRFGLDDATVQESVFVNGGQGDDGLIIDDSTIHGSVYSIDMAGRQTVGMEDVEIRGKLILLSGSDNDDAIFRNVTIRGSALLLLGSGDDTVETVTSTVQKNLILRTGGGNDFVQMQAPTVNGAAHLNMGSGNDSLVGAGTGTIRGRLISYGAGGTDAAEIATTITVTGRRTNASQESATVDDAVVTARLDNATTGARPRVTALRNSIVPSTEVGLTIDTSSNETETSNGGVLITKEAAFTIEGTTRAGATVTVDLDGDGQFDDATATANAQGEYSIDLTLTNTAANRGEFTINVKSSAGGFLDSEEELRVHFAVGTVLRVETTRGAIDIELLDGVAPITIANFLSYEDEYEGSIIHRSEKNASGNPFVIQGGGFKLDPDVVPVVTQAAIANEFNAANSNVRGTLSMALPPGNPAGGTSQWFINTGNNAFLDAQQHTVFGRVIGDGMTVVDAIHNLPSIDLSETLDESALNHVPLAGYTTFTENLTGTITVAASSTAVTGTGTAFTTELQVGQEFRIGAQTVTVASITSDTQLVLSTPHAAGATASTAQINAEPQPANYVRLTSFTELLA